MDAVSLTVGLCLIGSSLVTAGLAVPMARGRTRRNPWYGVRLPASMASDEAWDAINRYGGRRLIAASVPIFAAGMVALCVPLQPNPAWTVAFPAVVLASVAVALVRILRFAANYRRATGGR